MGNRVFTQKDKAFNTIYRLIIFICFAGSLAAVYGILAIVNAKEFGKNIIAPMTFMSYGYYVSLIGSTAAVIFSILAYKSGNTASLFFRTVFSIGICILEVIGHSFMRIVKFMCDIMNKYGYEYITGTSSPEEAGLTQSEIEQIKSFGKLDLDSINEDVYFYLFSGIFLGAVVYFILSITSLHSLLKQRNIPVSNGIPMDDELARYYSGNNSGYNDINNL